MINNIIYLLFNISTLRCGLFKGLYTFGTNCRIGFLSLPMYVSGFSEQCFAKL